MTAARYLYAVVVDVDQFNWSHATIVNSFDENSAAEDAVAATIAHGADQVPALIVEAGRFRTYVTQLRSDGKVVVVNVRPKLEIKAEDDD